MKQFSWWLWGLCLLAQLSTFAGCGKGVALYPADGKVVFQEDGAPLGGGWVEFQSTSAAAGPMARGEIQEDGNFRLGTFANVDGACEGEYRVLVVPPLQASERNANDRRKSSMIDRKFMSFDTSGLKYTVTTDSAKNHFQIQISRPKAL